MAIIRKYLTKDNYTKADNNIVKNTKITNGAKVLYWYMASFKNAFQLNDAYIKSGLGWSQKTISKYKSELKNWGYIHIEKIDRTTYFLYIGSSTKCAKDVMSEWHELEKIEK